MTQDMVSARGGSQAVRAARRDEAALLGEVLADAFAEDQAFAWLIQPQLRGARPPPGADPRVAGGAPATGIDIADPDLSRSAALVIIPPDDFTSLRATATIGPCEG